MTTKTLEEVKELAKGYDLVPIQEEIFADLVTPIQLLRKIAAGKKNYYLLESVEGERNGDGIRSSDMTCYAGFLQGKYSNDKTKTGDKNG